MLHNRIAQARNYAGYNQDEFAKKLGIGKRTLADYEKGVSEPKATVAVYIAEICNIDAWWLLTGKGSMLEEKKQKDELVAEDPQTAKLLKAWQSLPAEKKEMYFYKIMGDALEHEVMSNPIQSTRTATSSTSQKTS